MAQRIYDGRAYLRTSPFSTVFALLLGVAMFVWCVLGLPDAIAKDVHFFPAAFRSSPILAIFFTVIKLCSYVMIPSLYLAMVYIASRNLFLKRRFAGRLEQVSVKSVGEHEDILSVRLDGNEMMVRGPSTLTTALLARELSFQRVCLTVGAQNLVISADRVEEN